MNFKNYNFVKHRKIYFIISAVMVVIGALSLSIMGLNLGVDFESGTRLDVYLGQAFSEADIAREMEQMGLSATVNTAGDQDDRAVIRFSETLSKEKVAEINSALQEKYGDQIDMQESKVSPTVSRELAKKAFYAVLLASVAIILYVTIRFEFRFAISAIVALMHDAFFVITMFALLRVEVDLPFIAAVLTIVGYSINDTIVIFDRIRENLRKAKVKRKEDLEDVVNTSIQETLTRSINTVITVLFTAVALYVLGGEGIKNFSLALVLGLIAGAYSSIFLASQIWLVWKGRAVERERFAAARNEA
ncbi:MAG: protein translocase subunit SecF [Bacillaceae bacterium]|nr:protein translocase subunit SecF [Bacillaceae bacterium]